MKLTSLAHAPEAYTFSAQMNHGPRTAPATSSPSVRLVQTEPVPELHPSVGPGPRSTPRPVSLLAQSASLPEAGRVSQLQSEAQQRLKPSFPVAQSQFFLSLEVQLS